MPETRRALPRLLSAWASDSRVPEPIGELDRLFAPPDRGLGVTGEHPELCLGAVGHGELPPRRQRLEHVESPPGRGFGFRVASRVPEASREPPEGIADLEIVATLAPDAQHLLVGADRVVDRLREIALVRVRFEETGPLAGLERVGEPAGPCILRARLTMGVERRRAAGGCRRVLEHRRPVGRPLGMVREAGQGIGGRRSV